MNKLLLCGAYVDISSLGVSWKRSKKRRRYRGKKKKKGDIERIYHEARSNRINFNPRRRQQTRPHRRGTSPYLSISNRSSSSRVTTGPLSGLNAAPCCWVYRPPLTFLLRPGGVPGALAGPLRVAAEYDSRENIVSNPAVPAAPMAAFWLALGQSPYGASLDKLFIAAFAPGDVPGTKDPDVGGDAIFVSGGRACILE